MRHLRELPRRMLAAIKEFGFKQWFLLILNIVLVLASIGCAAGLKEVGGALSSLCPAGLLSPGGRRQDGGGYFLFPPEP